MSSLRLRRVVSVASSALLALLLMGPAAVSAATPLVDVGSTAFDVNTASGSPTVVSIGETGWFRTTLKNQDTSTISQLFLGVFSDATLYSFGSPASYAVSLTKNGSAVNAACGAGTNGASVSCSVRNVKPGDVVQATFVLRIPLTYPDGSAYKGSVDSAGVLRSCPIGDGRGYDNVMDPAAPTIAAPATCVLSMWSSNGAPSSDGGTSHGDTFNFNDGVAINTNLTDFRSRYVYQAGQATVANSQALSSANPHSTLAYAPSTGIPVTVFDADCSSAIDVCTVANTFGQASIVDVNGGTVPGTTWYHFLIQSSGTEVPSGVNQNNVLVVHSYTETGVTSQETISARCTLSKSTGLPTNAGPCLVVKKLSGGGLAVDVWTFHNGNIRFGY